MRDLVKRRLLLLPVLAPLILAVGACGGSSTTSPTPSPTVTTEVFSGSISQGGVATYPFMVSSSGYALMAAFTNISPSSVPALGMGLGAWDPVALTCGLNQAQADHAVVGSTAISGIASSGNYCIRVYDGGNITDPAVTVSFALQVQHY